MRDQDGLTITGSREAVDAIDSAVTAIHALTPDLAEHLDAAVKAAPGQPLARSLRALIALPYGIALDPAAEVAAAEDRGCSDRERSFLDATKLFVNGSPAAAAPAFLAHLSRWPSDTAASLPAYVATMGSGDPSMHQLLDEAATKQFASAPNWRTAHAAAFTLIDQGRTDEAAEVAWAALSERPDSGMLVHVLAHWHYETGGHEAGRSWLDEWRRERNFILYRSHFAWHSALHAMALGDTAGACALLVGQMDDTAVPDVGSLRWRLRLGGFAVPDREAAREFALQAASARAVPLPAWSAACGSAADGDGDAVRRLAAAARSWPMPAAPLMAKVLEGLADAAEGRWASCAAGLEGITAAGVPELGGSHAQREVIEDTRIVALLRSDRADEARGLLEERLARREHALDRTWISAGALKPS